MSDGNFNRSMLPYNNYQSGNRAGRAQMKALALEAFEKWCASHFQELDEAARHELYMEFKRLLP